MSTAPRLELRQSQSLVMTQALQQSIKLLQMNAMELRGYVESMLEENPFLAENEKPTEQSLETVSDAAPDEAESFTPDEWKETSDYRDGSELRTRVTSRTREGELMENESKAQELTLQEHLQAQLFLHTADAVLRRIGLHLIDLVDEGGYITADMDAVAEQLGTDEGHINRTFAVLHTFEPTGICARSVAECLGLQLKERDRLDPAMQALLANLDLVAAGKLEMLQRKCGVDAEDVKQMLTELRSLNPKPGAAFTREITQIAEPDVTVRRDNAGNWHVELNTSALPRVLVNRRYYATIAGKSKGQDKKYVTEKMQEASWLLKALDQRAHSILKVATEIVAQQENFFRMGIHHLKPLTLKDIARETGFHESTVSRVTTAKYMITPRGTYEFKYFFTSGLSHADGGENVSSQTVKHLIQDIIAKETNVLSDDDIAAILQRQNINVARRTVAKYREALGVPSSMERKRRAKAAGHG